MSIPPLVCSTPPPPDQCEEDKDPEDFDISYNLSQDDDDDGYNYGNFSSYNNFQSSADIKKENVLCDNVEILTSSKVKEPLKTETIEQDTTDEQHSGTNITTQAETKCEEDTNIEDLELEITEDSIDPSIKLENEEINGLSFESSISEINEVNEVIEDHLRTLSPSPATNDDSVESLSIEDKKQTSHEQVEEPLDLDVSNELYTASNSEAKQDLSETLDEPNEGTSKLDDVFEDFDGFQFANTENKPSPIIDTCDNPWESNETDTDFGNFTANFEADVSANVVKSDPVTEIIQKEVQSDDEFQNAVDDDDDFGDFNDFKCAVDNDTKDVSEETLTSREGPGINFHLSDNEGQVMESITNVLSSIFEEEVMEPQREFEGKLETMLSETWRHLRETDVRQPYIVNWNNSLGQKTLLRALCIDSRNILFGPKWGYNMPKYAVNLSNAPLQPQKPLTPSSSSQGDTASLEKASTKPGGWVDPFTSDGQESCNTESESVVEVTSSDLDVFEAQTQTKSEKIYSSTLNVQPLRQINLPDTHIFTPTDSETPRSKTIHYNNVPPILSQPVLDNTKPVESFPSQNTEPSNEKDDDDDWEFQDFRGSSGGTKTATAPQTEPPLEPKLENISKTNVTYQTQVLQPIRMEPLMPSLNWPDPGEVKETFEDFSDFVSKTSWNNEQSHITPQESRAIAESGTLEIINDGLKCIEVEAKEVPKLVPQAKSSESFDDDFDTFQSALPPKNSTSDFAFNSTSSNTFNNIPSQSIIKDFDYTFPKNNNKSDTISVENTRPNEALTQSLGFTPTPELTSNKKLLPLGNPMSSNLLQPLPMNSNTTQKHKKTAQILQPLSLESYSQINWPNPGIDLQDLSRFNPVETLQSLKTELSAGSGGGPSKGASPIHAQKNAVSNQAPDDDWGEFVSSKPKQQTLPKKAPGFVDDDEWTDFVSSPSVKPQNGLNTISLNVHTNSNIQKSSNKLPSKNSKAPLDIPTLNYITPKSSGHSTYNERHFQNL